MSQIWKQMSVLALAVLVASPLWAADEAGKKKKERDNKAVAKAFELPTEITLTDEQKTKLAEVKKEFEPKLKEVAKKQADILTAEQKQKRIDVTKSAKAAGKTGKDLQAEVNAALSLTEEQKKKQAEVGKEMRDLTAQVREKISSFLTADQKVHLKTKKKKTEKTA